MRTPGCCWAIWTSKNWCFPRRIKSQVFILISGSDIDILARRRLWEIGLDYGHGTGHGVGYFLNVHEGPNGISKYRTQAF